MTRCCVLLYTGDRSDRTTAMCHNGGNETQLLAKIVFQRAKSVLLHVIRISLELE